MSVGQNLISNFIGQAWVALINLAFIPIYIELLGIEAYGLVGLFALLQAWMGILDLGLTPTIGREMARYTGGGYSAYEIRVLLRSLEIFSVAIMLILVMFFACSASSIAQHWLNPDELPLETVETAIIAMGLVAASRYLENIYRSAILGLQRQVLFNGISVVFNTLRAFGAVAVLIWHTTSIEAFFIWQFMASAATTIALAIGTYWCIPSTAKKVRFSLDSLRRVWRFAGGILTITLLTLCLTQADKIIISKSLSLSDFGYYAFAAALAAYLAQVASPIITAIYPKLCEYREKGLHSEFAQMFHFSAQMISTFVGAIALTLIFFSKEILLAWTQDIQLSIEVAPLLQALVFSQFLHCLYLVPHNAQLAHGWTRLGVYVLLFSIPLTVPTMYFVVDRFGAIGAAWVYAALHSIGYLGLASFAMFRKILSAEAIRWYLLDTFVPIACMSVILLCFKSLLEKFVIDDFVVAQVLLAGCLSLLSGIFVSNAIRNWLAMTFLARHK